ncbi:erythrocyte band 7 integral membrane protein-like [Thalassophryne amazonica]|uniref:erythrocyte band 7 integral membrane protein-like n=1 Tax=Thalassophryne amazonica TaxID=390379 RepID=UPI0014725161|nr:erythrocyte band 7 integral membrane protein-like [Thalassophryne amazonica]
MFTVVELYDTEESEKMRRQKHQTEIGTRVYDLDLSRTNSDFRFDLRLDLKVLRLDSHSRIAFRQVSLLQQKLISSSVYEAFLQSPDGVLSCCDWFLVFLSYLMLLFTLPLSIWRCFKVIHMYERAVIYRLGRVWRGGNRGPGLVFVLPWTDTLMRVDVRTITFNIPPQEVVTEDLVRVWTDGVICYRVQNAAKCVTNVSDVHVAIRLLAQTAVRKVLSTMSLRDILSEQEEVTSIIQSTLEATTEKWGIQIQQVEIRMSNCPQQLHNSVSDKVKCSSPIKYHNIPVAAAEGHMNSPLMQKEAAVTGETAAAPRLRYLQTLQNSFFGGLLARGEYRGAMPTHGTPYAPPPVPSNACHVRLPV